ncbi:MAG: YncE family protein [Balneolaceae bacterium]
MNTMYKRYLYILSAVVLMTLFGVTACSDDPVSNLEDETPPGLLVINEGNFSEGDGSVTSYNPETGQAVQQKFQQVNGRPMAGIIQSASLSGDRLYIVANNTNKIEVVDPVSVESIATITFGGISPVGFVEANGEKGYASSLPDFNSEQPASYVYVVDLENYEVSDTRIEVGNSPHQMLAIGDRLYVANYGYGEDNTLSVIDMSTDEVMTTVTVGSGPIRMKADSDQRIWVVSNGNKPYNDPENNIPGQIDILDGNTSDVLETIETGGFPSAITLDETSGRAWVVNEEAVQQINMDTYEVTSDLFIDRSFNGIQYSPAEDRLYLAHSRGYTQSGQAIIYEPSGAAVDSFTVGYAPRDFLLLPQ